MPAAGGGRGKFTFPGQAPWLQDKQDGGRSCRRGAGGLRIQTLPRPPPAPQACRRRPFGKAGFGPAWQALGCLSRPVPPLGGGGSAVFANRLRTECKACGAFYLLTLSNHLLKAILYDGK